MKICIVVDDYLPHSIKVAGKMMHDLAIELQKLGNSIVIITPDDKISKSYLEDNYQGVKVLRFRSGKIKNVAKPIRLLNEFLISFRAKKNLRNWILLNHHDLVVFYSPTIFFSGLVSFLKSSWKCRSFLVLRDFFPQWTIDNGILKEGSFLVKFFRYYEKKNYKVADTIGIQSPANLKWFKNYFPDYDNTTLLFNWATENLSTPKKGNYSFRKTWNLKDKVIFFYGGNIGKAQYMKSLIDLSESMIDEKNAVFVFLGAGDEFEYVKDEINSKKLSNCLLMPSVKQDEYISILSEVDVGCICLHPNHKTHNFPGKILGYMQMNLPILGVVNTGNDIEPIINDSNSGFIVSSENKNQLTSHAKALLDKDLRYQLGKNSKQLLEDKFSVSSAASVILSYGK